MGGRARGVRWIFGLAVSGAGALAVAAPALATIPGGNLVANSGAELGRELPVLGWTNPYPQVAARDYVEPGTEGDFLSLDDPGTSGCRGFFGDTSSETRDATQLIDVSEAATEIDADSVTAGLAARIGNMPDGDYSSVQFVFRDAEGAQLGSTNEFPGSGLPPAASLVAFSAPEIEVPVGTREILVTVVTTRVAGANSAYADDIGLTLDGSDPLRPLRDCERPRRSLTIGYSAKKDRFKGKLKSSEGRCRRGKVVLFKVKSGPDRKVGTDRAGASGRWSMRERRARGKYYAATAGKRLDGLVCKPAKSPRRRAR